MCRRIEQTEISRGLGFIGYRVSRLGLREYLESCRIHDLLSRILHQPRNSGVSVLASDNLGPQCGRKNCRVLYSITSIVILLAVVSLLISFLCSSLLYTIFAVRVKDSNL